jgi:hypothetical protein
MHNGLRNAWAVMALATLAGCASEPEGARDGGYPGAREASSPGGSIERVTIRCESDHGHKRRCDVDTRGGVVLSRRMSTTPCVQGLNWDFDERGVWVTAGCRAEFTTGGEPISGVVHPEAKLVRCESDKGRRRRCDVAVTHGVDLRRNISRTPCIRGDNWGWDRGGVWVEHGCRGDFEVF